MYNRQRQLGKPCLYYMELSIEDNCHTCLLYDNRSKIIIIFGIMYLLHKQAPFLGLHFLNVTELCTVIVYSQSNKMPSVHSSRVSQLFTHCISIVWIETIITHSAPLSIAVHLHQTLTGVVAPSESYHTIVWVAPETRSHFNKYNNNYDLKQSKGIKRYHLSTYSRWQRHHHVHSYNWNKCRYWRSTEESPGTHWRSSPHHPVWWESSLSQTCIVNKQGWHYYYYYHINQKDLDVNGKESSHTCMDSIRASTLHCHT